MCSLAAAMSVASAPQRAHVHLVSGAGRTSRPALSAGAVQRGTVSSQKGDLVVALLLVRWCLARVMLASVLMLLWRHRRNSTVAREACRARNDWSCGHNDFVTAPNWTAGRCDRAVRGSAVHL